MKMEKQFVPYELAVKLKELGFDEKCLAAYNKDETLDLSLYLSQKDAYNLRAKRILAPLWQQAFQFIQTKIDLFEEGFKLTLTSEEWLLTNNIYYWTNEDALKELIKIYKTDEK